MTSRSFRVFMKLCETNVREFSRDSVAAFFSFLFPLLFLVLFGVTETFRQPLVFDLAVVTPGGGRAAEPLLDVLATQKLVRGRRLTFEGGLARLKNATVPTAVLVLPAADANPDAPARLLVEDRWASVARLALDSARAELAVQQLGYVLPLRYTIERPPFRAVSDFGFIFPGLIAMALLQLGLFATASPLLRARDRGTLRHLSTTPVSRLTILGAQLTLRMLVAGGQLLLLIGLGTWLFRMDIAGSWLLVAVMTALGAAMMIALGYALAGLAPSQESGMVIILLVNFAMLFLGQVFFDLSGVPLLSVIVRFVPLTYLSDALRQLVLGVSGLFPIAIDAAAIALWTIATVLVATRTFRFDLEPR